VDTWIQFFSVHVRTEWTVKPLSYKCSVCFCLLLRRCYRWYQSITETCFNTFVHSVRHYSSIPTKTDSVPIFLVCWQNFFILVNRLDVGLPIRRRCSMGRVGHGHPKFWLGGPTSNWLVCSMVAVAVLGRSKGGNCPPRFWLCPPSLTCDKNVCYDCRPNHLLA